MSRSTYNRITVVMGLCALIAASALLGLPYWQQDFVIADLRTETGQRLGERLDDGSLLDLDAGTTVALQFDDDQHRIRLLTGQILLQAAATPLAITTPQGRIETRDARLLVERLDDTTLVSQLSGSSRIGPDLNLDSGQQVRLSADGAGPVHPLDAVALQRAWTHHQLLAIDQPLAEVLERLARHHPGLLLFDRTVLARQRVTATLPTDDSNAALTTLAQQVPLRIRRLGPWLTLVSLVETTH